MKQSKKDAGKCSKCGHRRSWWNNVRGKAPYRADSSVYLCQFCNQAGCSRHGDLSLVWCAGCHMARLCPECSKVIQKGSSKVYVCGGCYYRFAEEALST